MSLRRYFASFSEIILLAPETAGVSYKDSISSAVSPVHLQRDWMSIPLCFIVAAIFVLVFLHLRSNTTPRLSVLSAGCSTIGELGNDTFAFEKTVQEVDQ